jgi:hypothetical protein
VSEPADPWHAPSDPAPRPLPEGLAPWVAGLTLTLVLHGVATTAAWSGPLWGAWTAGFGVLQLLYVAPLAGVAVLRGAPRPFVLGVFSAAALAFLLDAALQAAHALGVMVG